MILRSDLCAELINTIGPGSRKRRIFAKGNSRFVYFFFVLLIGEVIERFLVMPGTRLDQIDNDYWNGAWLMAVGINTKRAVLNQPLDGPKKFGGV
jgi:hypothetical protein